MEVYFAKYFRNNQLYMILSFVIITLRTSLYNLRTMFALWNYSIIRYYISIKFIDIYTTHYLFSIDIDMYI